MFVIRPVLRRRPLVGCFACPQPHTKHPMLGCPASLPGLQLACARIGAVHAVVFGGFSAEALAGRIEGCKAKVIHLRGRMAGGWLDQGLASWC